MPKFRQTRIFPKNLLRSVFSVYSPLTSCTLSEKNNERILKKSKKSPFLGPFCPNLGKREFSRKIGLCHFFTLMNLQLHAKYQKNQMNQFWEKCVTNVRTDGRTDGRTWIYRTLRPPDGGPKKENTKEDRASWFNKLIINMLEAVVIIVFGAHWMIVFASMDCLARARYQSRLSASTFYSLIFTFSGK